MKLRTTLAAAALEDADRRTADADQIIRDLLRPAREESTGLLVMATGGYARADLAPGSDLDLLLLVAEADTHTDTIRTLIHGLWDRGMKPAQTMLHLSDLDPSLFTIPDRASSLLETRIIWGDSALAWEYEAQVNEQFDDEVWEEYVRQKLGELRARRAKYSDVPRVVEPHLKNDAGGMRDLHHVLWLERARDARRNRWRTRRRRGSMVAAFIGRLKRDHLLTAWEADQLIEAYGLRLAVRGALHAGQKRVNDLLTVPGQPTVGRHLGYDGPDRTVMRDMMLDVYWAGEKLNRFCREFSQRFTSDDSNGDRQPSSLIEHRGVTVAQKRLELAGPALRHYSHSPADLLELIDLSVSDELPFSGRARHSLRRALHGETGPQHNPANWAQPLATWFDRRSGFSARLRRLDELDAIGLWLPEWGEIAGLTTGSYYHRYTVDEHTLRALAVLDELPSDGLEGGPAAVWDSCTIRPVVYLSVIFHDIAKGRTGDHSLEGANVAQTALARLGMDALAAQVAKLVRLHLRMEQTAFRRDFSDPATLTAFATEVGDESTLTALYLLTVCDLNAVRDGVWSAWKGRLLSELFLATRNTLRRGLSPERLSPSEEAANIAPFLNGPDPADRDRARQFIGTLEEEYWRNVPSDEIATHMAIVEQMQKGEVDHRWLIDRYTGYLVITLLDHDRTGLLANIAGLLTAQGIGIREARIFTREDGIIIDRFRAEDIEPTALTLDRRLEQIPELWRELSTGTLQVADLFARLERRMRRANKPEALVETEISVRPVIDGALIDVSGSDRVGLLHRLCSVLASEGFDVRSARVSGRIDGIIDSFLVADAVGRLSRGEEQQSLISKLHQAAGDAGAA